MRGRTRGSEQVNITLFVTDEVARTMVYKRFTYIFAGCLWLAASAVFAQGDNYECKINPENPTTTCPERQWKIGPNQSWGSQISCYNPDTGANYGSVGAKCISNATPSNCKSYYGNEFNQCDCTAVSTGFTATVPEFVCNTQ